MRRVLIVLAVLVMTPYVQPVRAVPPTPEEMAEARRWADVSFRGIQPPEGAQGSLLVLANHDPVQKNTRSGARLTIGKVEYARGLFCHANSEILVRLPGPGTSFTAVAGIESRAGGGSVVFAVRVSGKEVFRSGVVRFLEPAVPVRVDLRGAREFTIAIGDGGDGISFDQSVWADARVTLVDGKELWLGDMPFARGLRSSGPPFSFQYGGKPFADLMRTWKLDRKTRQLDGQRTEHTVSFTDPGTGLVVRSVGIEYHDFPTVEWTLYFKNTGSTDSPIVSDVQALDVVMAGGTPDGLTLNYHVGGESGPQDFQPQTLVLGRGVEKQFTTWFGFPTATNLPFFNVQSKDEGILLGLGWPGAWAARFRTDEGLGVRITAGQELTRFKLHPGEEVRTPLVAVQFWKGDRTHAQNIWRRWMVAHNVPRPSGKLPSPMTAGHFPALEGANEKDLLLFINRYLEEGLKPDYWWVDAGWYPNKGKDWQDLLGTWEVDFKRFPRGLRGVFDFAHSKGIKSIVWFEPERVQPESWLYTHHPEWLLGHDGGTKLFNHGNPAAHAWLTAHIGTLITEQDIDLYRQDYACFARDLWRANDPPDRQGITEIRYVTGYLAYLDELIARHPGLLIDICAAGGKRLELENLRRAVPLWRSDYVMEPVGTQSQTYGLAFWLPFFGTGTGAESAYVFRSNMGPSTVSVWDMRRKDLNYKSFRTWIAQWKEVAPDYYGDYYPLTPYRLEKDVWMAWQFDRPEVGEGMVQVFRREESPFESARFRLKALVPEGRYSVRDLDTGGMKEYLGRDLLGTGFPIVIPDQPGSVLLKYRRVDTHPRG